MKYKNNYSITEILFLPLIYAGKLSNKTVSSLLKYKSNVFIISITTICINSNNNDE